MLERELSLTPDSGNVTTLSFDGDKKSEVLKLCKEIVLAINFFASEVNKNTATVGVRVSALNTAEYKFVDLVKKTGHDSDLAKEHEGRYVEIRAANEENRQLRQRLGEKFTTDDIREAIKRLEKNVREWWDEEGFGYVSDFKVGGWGVVEITLTSSLIDSSRDNEGTKQWHNKLREKGFKLLQHRNDPHDVRVLSDDDSLKVLVEMIKDRFPSVSIGSIETNYFGRERPIFGDIKIFVRNLDDLEKKI